MKDKIVFGLKWFFRSFIWLGILLLVIDIVTKNVVIANKEYITSLPDSRLVLIPNFLAITYTVNRNAAFGVGVGSDLANRIVYIVIAVLAIGALTFLYVKKFKKLNLFYRACLNLVLVGALGNLIDRIFFTSSYLGVMGEPGVVDWIDFFGIWKFVFNIADCCIVIGVIMLIIYLIVDEVKTSKKKKKESLSIEMVKDKKEALEKEKQEAVIEEEKTATKE